MLESPEFSAGSTCISPPVMLPGTIGTSVSSRMPTLPDRIPTDHPSENPYSETVATTVSFGIHSTPAWRTSPPVRSPFECARSAAERHWQHIIVRLQGTKQSIGRDAHAIELGAVHAKTKRLRTMARVAHSATGRFVDTHVLTQEIVHLLCQR